jgi:putative ABC transport system substrate-binding protein
LLERQFKQLQAQMTGRRKYLLALGAGALWRPLQVFAQKAGAVPVVGVLALGVEGRVGDLREGLRRLGHVDGRSVRLEERVAGERYERLAEIANEYVRLKVDVIVSFGTSATVAARKATATIPIVMMAGVDPVKEKLAASLSRPGGNVTGVSTIVQELVPKRLELAKETFPNLARLGILWNPDSKGSANSLAQAQSHAKSLNLQLQVVEARSSADYARAFETLAKARAPAYVSLPTGMFATSRKPLLDSAAKHRLGGIFPSGDWGDSGGLLTYGPDVSEAVRRAAVFVDKILNGAKPGDLPIEQPTKLELVVNLKAAKALGITIPRSVLLRADRVIE